MTDSIPSSRPPFACAPRCRGSGDLAAVRRWCRGAYWRARWPCKNGLTPARGCMSAIVLAGAAQLVAMGMIKGGAGLLAILLSIFFVTAQHFLCAAAAGAHCAAAVTLAADPDSCLPMNCSR